MSARIDKSWVVFDSIENGQHDRCVDLFRRPDGSFRLRGVSPRCRGCWRLDAGCVPFGRRLCLEGRRLERRRPSRGVAGRGAEVDRTQRSGGNVARAKANGIEIEYETAGDKSDPALLLIMGLGAQLTIWPDALFEGLAQAGLLRHPLRQPRHRPVDRLRLLGRAQHRRRRSEADDGQEGRRALSGEGHGGRRDRPARCARHRAAHMVGASMGGMIVQIVAAQYPERTRSLVSIMSTSGRPGLPQGKPEALAMLTAQPEGPSREQLRQARHEAAPARSAARAIPIARGRAARLRREERRPPLVSRGRRPAVSRRSSPRAIASSS